MKKVYSIALVLLMLTVMLHLSVATHYCGGNIAALKVSLNGKLASCGMMGCTENDYHPGEAHFFTNCCDDVVTFYATDSNYTPSFSVIPEFYEYNLQVFNLPLELPFYPSESFTSLYINASPPNASLSTNVDLSDICVLRI